MIMMKSRFLFGKDNYVQREFVGRVEKQKNGRCAQIHAAKEKKERRERGSVPSQSLSQPPPFFFFFFGACVLEQKRTG